MGGGKLCLRQTIGFAKSFDPPPKAFLPWVGYMGYMGYTGYMGYIGYI